MRYEIKQTEKANKIFKRLCKEIGIYPGKFYKDIMNFFEYADSYVFYGRDEASYSSYGEQTEIKFYRLQFDLARKLIEDNILRPDDYNTILNDTLYRYDVKKSDAFRDKWQIVAKRSGKRDFVDFFILKYQEKIKKLPISKVGEIYDTLPTN